MDNNNYSNILNSLEMHALIVLGTDLHQLEHPEAQFQFRHALSGFQGSAGTLVLYANNGHSYTGLWTDDRYGIAAKNIVHSNTQVYITTEHDYQSQIDWLISCHENSNSNNTVLRVGISALQTTINLYNSISQYISEVTKSSTINIDLFPIDFSLLYNTILNTDDSYKQIISGTRSNTLAYTLDFCNPKFKHLCNDIWNLAIIQQQYPLDESITSQPTDWKHIVQMRITQLENWIQQQEGSAYFSTNVHELAWLLYLRSMSMTMPFLAIFPVVFIYSMHDKTFTLWIPQKILGPLAKEHIQDIQESINITLIVNDYQELIHNSSKIHDTYFSQNNIIYNPETCPVAFYNENAKAIPCPITLWKSFISEYELENYKQSIQYECIALLEALAYINTQLTDGKEFTEQEINTTIHEYRLQQAGYLQPSFSSIIASGPHAAQPHYSTSSDIASKYQPLLIDTGGHYLYGSTDLTRVFCFANVFQSPSQELSMDTSHLDNSNALQNLFIDDYTIVLKTHIAMASYKSKPITDLDNHSLYPTGKEIDALVHEIMQQYDRNYNHGTGHGIGYLTDVHEGVQRVSPKSTQHILPNMVITNEPGIYREGLWGIRLENVLVSYIDNSCLAFTTLSKFPFQSSCINYDLLDEKERQWLIEYQDSCKESLMPLASSVAKEYLSSLL